MSKTKNKTGTIGWVDLTVPNAEEVQDFYAAVVGWKPEPVSMGEYNDFNMTDPEEGTPLAGICHAKGGNKDLPPQWMIYVHVDDIEASATKVRELGGSILKGPTDPASYGRYCIIKDPAGVVMALFEEGREK